MEIKNKDWIIAVIIAILLLIIMAPMVYTIVTGL